MFLISMHILLLKYQLLASDGRILTIPSSRAGSRKISPPATACSCSFSGNRIMGGIAACPGVRKIKIQPSDFLHPTAASFCTSDLDPVCHVLTDRKILSFCLHDHIPPAVLHNLNCASLFDVIRSHVSEQLRNSKHPFYRTGISCHRL